MAAGLEIVFKIVLPECLVNGMIVSLSTAIICASHHETSVSVCFNQGLSFCPDISSE